MGIHARDWGEGGWKVQVRRQIQLTYLVCVYASSAMIGMSLTPLPRALYSGAMLAQNVQNLA